MPGQGTGPKGLGLEEPEASVAGQGKWGAGREGNGGESGVRRGRPCLVGS